MRESGLAKVYVATAEARDAETARRIAAHRDLRAGQGWRTVEAPVEAARALAQIEREEVALLESATHWLSNLLLAGHDWVEAAEMLLEALAMIEAPVVIVTDEVGLAPRPESEASRRFREAMGQLNQRLAARADLVVMVTAGLPQVLKGDLPGG